MGKLDPRAYRKIAFVLAAAVLLAAAACSSSTPPPQPLVMGAIYPLSGSQAQGGKEELGGLQAALAEAAAARADARHVVYWETGAVADDITQRRHWVFRTVATGMNLGRTAVDFTKSALLTPGGSAVIVNVNDVYGRSVADGEVAEAAAQGLRVAARIEYDPLHYDADAIARQVGAAHATWLWDVSYIADGIGIWRQVHEQGIPLRAAVGTSSAFCVDEFGTTLGSAAVGVFAADKPDGTINPSALSAAAQ